MATGEFSREEMLRHIVTLPLSKDLEEKLKLVQKAITIEDRTKKLIIATMKRYYADKPDTTYLQIRHFIRKDESEKLQQLVFVNHKLDEVLSFLDVVNSVSERALLNQSFCNFCNIV